MGTPQAVNTPVNNPPRPTPVLQRPPANSSGPNLADPNRAPSMEDLAQVKYVSSSSAVATPAQITKLGEWFVKVGIEPNSTGPAMWDLARAYADVQASRSAMLTGASAADPNVSRQSLARQLDAVFLTPRQFCMYFAKVVWNILLTTQVPPASWAKLGYSYDCRFAAFDFFDGVLNPAALDPADGLVRQPSPREIQAHQVAKSASLARQRISEGNFVSSLSDVTHGRIGGINSMYAIEAPPEF
ncbi:coat protein [Lettuce virus X]|uniref:Capsid protein n=1 Tax=Lettuce virus X TaxID=447171 RepID=B3CJG6_9VIRU|nr:coat protein [Lettuce virus X]QWT83780.1 capsid protein [Lettuce virus X]CAN88812.1 coat protein [Lettuce virus X]